MGNRGTVPKSKIRDTYDSSRHPEVCNGKKNEEEQLTEFLENYEVHHNTFNNYKKNDRVSMAEFREFYRTLSCNYEEDAAFVNMVKGVWGVKQENIDNSQRSFAGGNDASVNSRDRYMKQNNKGTPFGTSGGEQWQTQNNSQYTKKSNVTSGGAGSPSKQS